MAPEEGSFSDPSFPESGHSIKVRVSKAPMFRTFSAGAIQTGCKGIRRSGLPLQMRLQGKCPV